MKLLPTAGMKAFWLALIFASLSGASVWPATTPNDPVDAYNVVWTSPSQDSSGSMPLGNGEVGVNLWVEPDGDLLFYIARTDAWDEAWPPRRVSIWRNGLSGMVTTASRSSIRQEIGHLISTTAATRNRRCRLC